MRVGAIIVAAGRGERAGGGVPKQWRKLAGRPVAQHAMLAFATHPAVTELVLVLHEEDRATTLWPRDPAAHIVTGGASRSDSVFAGLRALEGLVDLVLIHDAARPCVTSDVIDAVLSALNSASAAAPAVAVVDALWTGQDGRVTGTANRDGLYRAQTPQGFHFKAILEAHQRFPDGAADDVEIARRAGIEVAITQGHEDNLKITTPADFARAEAILRARDGY
ncbi:MAG: 2-C-methyl-D-erythritol 4-phosphate cytidylyltransferase [Pseudomonadota bacterium]